LSHSYSAETRGQRGSFHTTQDTQREGPRRYLQGHEAAGALQVRSEVPRLLGDEEVEVLDGLGVLGRLELGADEGVEAHDIVHLGRLRALADGTEMA
jgi:hypothetical protein